MEEGQIDLGARVMSLPRRSQIALVAACSEQLLPLYQQFSIDERWGDPSALEQAIERIWDYLISSSSSHLEDALLACEEVTPDMDNFHTGLASLALDSVLTVTAVIEACLKEESTAKVMEAKAMIDEVAFALSQRSVFNDRLRTVQNVRVFSGELDDSVVERELESQSSMIEFLESVTEISPRVVEALRHLAMSHNGWLSGS
jgi:uncharacterized protein YjaG (DUF416 family)